jgi:LytS/YehU family sensor histidine kinase
MINDGEADTVSLKKEIQLMQNYIGLEKVRYGDRLHLQVDLNGDYENKMIAPLLMIPFVENSFKHGVSIMRGTQWIKIALTIQNKWLYFSIGNSKPVKAVSPNGKEGIGLMNVQKRLQLLYPGKHELTIQSTDEDYWVHMQIELQEQPAPPVTGNPIVQSQPLLYA